MKKRRDHFETGENGLKPANAAHLDIAVRSRADRSPPVRIRLRRTDSCEEATRNLALSEVPEWTYEPVEDDLPLADPLTL